MTTVPSTVVRSSYRSPSILALSLHPRKVGHIVLDGIGVAEGSFGAWNLSRHRSAVACEQAVERLLERTLRRYQPRHVILGLPARAKPLARRYAERLARGLRARGIRFDVLPNHAGVQALLGTLRAHPFTTLGRTIAEHLLPELRIHVTGPGMFAEYRRAAWYAVALALRALAEHHPRVAGALVHTRTRGPEPFVRVIQHAEMKLHPAL